jgi:hypothetical protein
MKAPPRTTGTNFNGQAEHSSSSFVSILIEVNFPKLTEANFDHEISAWRNYFYAVLARRPAPDHPPPARRWRLSLSLWAGTFCMGNFLLQIRNQRVLKRREIE